jgi:DNA-binding NarL/FixJ family response regulator
MSQLLTAAELEVGQALAQGYPNAAIAARRGTSVDTIKKQVQAIMIKLQAGNRVEVARILIRNGMVPT